MEAFSYFKHVTDIYNQCFTSIILHPWMTHPKKDMNLTSFKDLTVDKDIEVLVQTECFPEPIMSEKSDISAHCFTVQLPTRDLYLT